MTKPPMKPSTDTAIDQMPHVRSPRDQPIAPQTTPTMPAGGIIASDSRPRMNAAVVNGRPPGCVRPAVAAGWGGSGPMFDVDTRGLQREGDRRTVLGSLRALSYPAPRGPSR